MELIIKDSMNENVIKEASLLYSIKLDSISFIGGFENLVYQFKKEDKDYILRFVHSSHRTLNLVKAEVEFIEFLSNNGANVSEVIKSKNNKLVERINSKNTYFSVCVFTKALGAPIKDFDATDNIIVNFGKQIGKLHRLTKLFKPNNKRHDFFDENYIDIGKRNLPKEDMWVIDKMEEIISRLKRVKKSNDNFGLIHADLHFGNMFFVDDNMTFFDFDDCSYQNFINEFSVIIHDRYAYSKLTDAERAIDTNRFLKLLLEGYKEENQIDYLLFKYFHDYIKLREAIMYIMIYAAGDKMINSPFWKEFLVKSKNRIRNNSPFFDLEIALKDIYFKS